MLALTLAQTTLPEGGMIPLFVALAAGVALWLAGVKLVRVVFIALGAAVGGFAGSVLLPLTGMPALPLGSLTLTPGFTGVLAGGVIGALVALAMLRIVIILTAAGAMGVVGAMAALVFLHFNPTAAGPDEAPDAPYADAASELRSMTDDLARATREQTGEAMDRLNRSLSDDPGANQLLADLNTEENRERLRDAAERSRAYLSHLSEVLRAEYDRRPARDKLVILSSTTAGLGVGLLIGLTMPRRSSALVTSLLGSALWLAAGVALIRANADPDPNFLTQPPLAWAVVWALTAVVGMTVQFGLIKRRGSKDPAPEDD